MECEHLQGEVCQIAKAKLAGLRAGEPKPRPSDCQGCERQDNPRAWNRVTRVVAIRACEDRACVAAISGIEDQILAAIKTGHGPGSQLWRLLEGLGIQHQPGCKCIELAARMNELGAGGCRRERPLLVEQIKANLKNYGWGDLIFAAAKALSQGLAWRLNLADPVGSCVDEAINLAERAGLQATVVIPPAPTHAATIPKKDRTRLLLTCKLCPGDILTMTAAVESLHLTYPGEYQVDVRTPHAAIWENNPRIEPGGGGNRLKQIELHYPSIGRCNEESIPFLAGYTEYLGEQLGRPLRLRTNRPYLYLSAEERGRPLSSLWPGAPDLGEIANGKPIWLVNAGTKRDYTIKGWPLEYYQEVINRTKERICWIQIGLRKDLHRDLSGVVNLMDGARQGPPLRETILLAYWAAGGLGPVTFLQHLMAAWSKPYICLVGGREPATWVQYPYQHTLHTVGALDCCRQKSCWRARVVPLKDGDEKDKSLCERPVVEALERPAAACMAMIQPLEVLALLERLVP